MWEKFVNSDAWWSEKKFQSSQGNAAAHHREDEGGTKFFNDVADEES